MKLIKKGPPWTYSSTCWNCGTEFQADEDDLVHTEDFVGEDSHRTENFCVDCPNCGEGTTVEEEECTFDAMKLARSKGLRSAFDKKKFTTVS